MGVAAHAASPSYAVTRFVEDATYLSEVVRFEDVYRLCYIRGPEGILLGLAEAVS